MQIMQHTISTKAGEEQILRWLVVQSRPYPTIAGECGRLKWQNTEGLFDRYQHPATGLGNSYTAYLLAPDAQPTENYSRADFAGYVACRSDKPPKPGTIKFRGHDLGETRIELTTRAGDFPAIRVNDGSTAPTSSARAMFEEKIIPALRQFIAEHAKELRDEAIEAVRAKFAAELDEARKRLDVLQAEAEKAKF